MLLPRQGPPPAISAVGDGRGGRGRGVSAPVRGRGRGVRGRGRGTMERGRGRGTMERGRGRGVPVRRCGCMWLVGC